MWVVGAVLVPALCRAIGLYQHRDGSVIPNPPEGESRLAAEADVTKLFQYLTGP